MTTRVAVNGLGRTGRQFIRACLRDPDYGSLYEVVALNDLADPRTLAYFLKYDSVHGVLDMRIEHGEGSLEVGGRTYSAFSIAEPERLPWKEMGVDVVVESTGRFRGRRESEGHLRAGAGKVVISAPAEDPDVTVVPGVNMEEYDHEHHRIISAASCTTNCLAPMMKVLLEKFGVERGFMTTVHAYTNDQRVLDLMHKDLRRSRAASLSIIPTTTGAAAAIGAVLPQLDGKLDGIALRVPVPDGSVVDLVVELQKRVTKEEVNRAYVDASRTGLRGILGYTEDPIVSADIVGDSRSCIVDGQATTVMGGGGEMVKILGWYDNEWGYANRLLDVIKHIASKGGGGAESSPRAA